MRLLRWLLAPLRPWLPGWLIRWVFWRRVTYTYTEEELQEMLHRREGEH